MIFIHQAGIEYLNIIDEKEYGKVKSVVFNKIEKGRALNVSVEIRKLNKKITSRIKLLRKYIKH